jgi:hypothetical protein
VRQRFRPGEESWFACDAPTGPFSVVFEDDGETGYIYALERLEQSQPILDALLVYRVRDLADPTLPDELEITWADDGLHALLKVNGRAHAVFDFEARRGWCRTGFPPPLHTGWSPQGHAWDDAALISFD